MPIGNNIQPLAHTQPEIIEMLPFYQDRLEAKFAIVLQFIFGELRGWMERTLSDVGTAVMFSVRSSKRLCKLENGTSHYSDKIEANRGFMSKRLGHNDVVQ